MSPLGGGRNSRTYVVTNEFGTQFVLKSYLDTLTHLHDRQRAEINFLQYCAEVGIDRVPRVLAWSTAATSTLFTKVPGLPFAHFGRPPATADIRQIAEFIDHLNCNLPISTELEPAAEACFSIIDHLRTVERRIQRVSTIEDSSYLHRSVGQWVRKVLVPNWRVIFDGVLKTCSPDELNHTLEQQQIRISPSDLGFHNVLIDEQNRMYFVDFEYAGYDDPAKLLCDSFLQPRNSLSESMRRILRRALHNSLQLNPSDQRRVDLLMPVYTIKWACIVLNSFVLNNFHPHSSSGPSVNGIDMNHQFLMAKALVHELVEG